MRRTDQTDRVEQGQQHQRQEADAARQRILDLAQARRDAGEPDYTPGIR